MLYRLRNNPVSYQGIALAIPQILEIKRPFRGGASDIEFFRNLFSRSVSRWKYPALQRLRQPFRDHVEIFRSLLGNTSHPNNLINPVELISATRKSAFSPPDLANASAAR